MPIKLPHAKGEEFDAEDLKNYLRQRGEDSIVIGAQQKIFDNHTKPLSLDYWIRDRLRSHRDTKQAVSNVIDQLEDNDFISVKVICPHSGRSVNGLRLVNSSEKISNFHNRNNSCGDKFTWTEDIENNYINETSQNVVQFVKEDFNLETLFQWEWDSSRIERILGQQIPTSLSNSKKIEWVRKSVRERISTEKLSAPELIILMEIFVEDFGGVRSNRNFAERARYAINLATQDGVCSDNVDLANISTISKCLNILPCKLPIYDARVAYSINAINWLNNTRRWYLLSPAGRNARINSHDMKTLFLQANSTASKYVATVVSSDSLRVNSTINDAYCVPADRVYSVYTKIIENTDKTTPSAYLITQFPKHYLYAV